LLVFWFAYRLSRKPVIACVTAALFGIHPLHCESVAWISERKDLLCAVFYCLALIEYLKYIDRKKAASYALCLLFTVLSLLSKPMAVTLPVILLLLDHFYGRGINIKTALAKAPFFAAAFIFGIINMIFQKGATVGVFSDSPAGRLYFLSKVIPFYISKAFVPIRLSAMYSYHDIAPQHAAQIKYYLAALILILAVVVFLCRRFREVRFGSLFSFITILPVLQIIHVGNAFAADRYMYLPSIGVFFSLAFLFERSYSGLAANKKALRLAIAAAVILWAGWLSVLTWDRCAVWKDSATFYKRTLPFAGNSPTMNTGYGIVYYKQGNYKKALRLFKKAVELNPRYSKAYNNLANTYFSMGDTEKAIGAYKKAIEIKPDYASVHSNLALVYYSQGKYRLAAEHVNTALRLGFRVDPKFVDKLRQKVGQ
ncbi:tetratricopeptide repeat protein, partial [Candidatus Omnitrophota bacterium]